MAYPYSYWKGYEYSVLYTIIQGDTCAWEDGERRVIDLWMQYSY